MRMIIFRTFVKKGMMEHHQTSAEHVTCGQLLALERRFFRCQKIYGCAYDLY